MTESDPRHESPRDRKRLARQAGLGRLSFISALAGVLVAYGAFALLADPTARYCDLGAGFYDTRVNAERKKRNHVRQLEALGYKVTLEPAA